MAAIPRPGFPRHHILNGQSITHSITGQKVKQSGKPMTIATITVERLAASGIHTFRVSEHIHSSLIFAPEDDEIILVCPNAEFFPKEIIVDIFEAGDAVT